MNDQQVKNRHQTDKRASEIKAGNVYQSAKEHQATKCNRWSQILDLVDIINLIIQKQSDIETTVIICFHAQPSSLFMQLF